MLKSLCQIDKIKSNVRFTGCTLLSCRVNYHTAITETHNRARASGKYQRAFSTTLANRPPPSSSYFMRRTPERISCRGLQPKSYQAPAFDSDSCACQAFVSHVGGWTSNDMRCFGKSYQRYTVFLPTVLSNLFKRCRR